MIFTDKAYDNKEVLLDELISHLTVDQVANIKTQ